MSKADLIRNWKSLIDNADGDDDIVPLVLLAWSYGLVVPASLLVSSI